MLGLWASTVFGGEEGAPRPVASSAPLSAAMPAPLAAVMPAPLAAATRRVGPTLVRVASSFGISRPLAEIAFRAHVPIAPPDPEGAWERENRRVADTRPRRTGPSRDAALSPGKTPLSAEAVLSMPATSVEFEGISASNNTAIFGGGPPLPPDPNGDVGPNHYVQTVNTLVRVYQKDGTPLTPFFPISDLFASVGPPCAGTNDGDPIVLYDPLADRWLISQLCIETTAGREHQIVAISTTGDPTGTFFEYDFVLPNDKANDYPHFGVWPDAYYMTNNQFVGDTDVSAGGGAYAFDRAKMLAGDPSASFVYFDVGDIDPEVSGELPTDLDGIVVPPAGTPNLFVDMRATEFGDPADALRIFAFHVDFANPSASTFTALPDVPLAAFDPRDTGQRNSVAQPPPADSSEFLDSLAVQLMHRIAYRTLSGGAQSYVLNFVVNVSGTDPTGDPSAYQAGIRWVELRRNAGTGAVTVNQQGTYSTDPGNGATGRDIWMGSIAQDHDGDIALGFSASCPADPCAGTTTVGFPSIAYAGRLAGDTAGQLAQGEAILQAGGGSQTSGSNRWGDYTAMSVDPADECTFWYTNEYYPSSSGSSWHTRVGAFKFPSCTAEGKGTIHGTVSSCSGGAALAGVTITTPEGYVRTTSGSGGYSLSVAPGSYTLTAHRAGYADVDQPVTVAAGGNQTVDFCLTPVPVFVAAGSALTAEECPPGNGGVDPGEVVTLNLCLANTGVAGSGDVVGTLALSGGIDLSDSQDFGALPAGGAPVCRPFRTRAQGACGSTATAKLNLTNAGNAAGSVTFPILLGAENVPLSENFDGVTVPALPSGWTATNASGPAPLWVTTSTQKDTLPNAAFINDPAGVSDKRLTTPSFGVATGSTRLTFRQRIDIDEFFDGGVLEVSSPNIASGAFTDVTSPAVGGSFLAGGYGATLETGSGNPIEGRLAWTGNSFGWFTTIVDLGPNVAGQTIKLRWRLGTDSAVSKTGWWIDSIRLSDGATCCTVSGLLAAPMSVDDHSGPGVVSDGNGVFEKSETVIVAPAWKNVGGAALPLTGTASAFTGPGAGPYTIADSAASYGTIAPGATNDCFTATGNCYRLTLPNPASRPATHWDGTFQETPSTGPAKTWTLHVGDSFTDVPRSNPFYKKVETIFHNGITAGCSPTTYCPSDSVSRAQMAIFLARGLAGSGAAIPAGGTLNGKSYFCGSGGVSGFTDVSPTDSACKAIHFIGVQNVTLGCTPTAFCPNQTVSRDQMSAFLARSVLVPGGGASIPTSYGPDPVTGLSYSCATGAPNIHFVDVPATNPFCKSVHYLWARGMVAGCSANAFCPTGDVTRDAMAKFLANAFGLFLYPP